MSRPQENMWSRRRAGVRAEAEVEQQAADADERAEQQQELADKSDADILQELNLTDPDQMQPGDDFAAFMRAEVPDRLRKRALRTLWRSNPVLACVDNLVDYGDDFKAEWNGAGLIRTVYRVGKGMLADVEENDPKTADEVLSDPEDVAEVPEAVTEALTEAKDEEAGPIVSGKDLEEPVETEDIAHMTARRRMRFEFEEAS